MGRFDLDLFVEQCRQALREPDPRGAMHERVERAVRLGSRIREDIPPGLREVGGLAHYSPELTILCLDWPPRMYDPPHDHRCWAVVGVYVGEEASVTYDTSSGGLHPTVRASLGEGDAVVLATDTVHSVTNPLTTWTAALHVYAGDFLSPRRREWDPVTGQACPWDPAESLDRYAAAVAAAVDSGGP